MISGHDTWVFQYNPKTKCQSPESSRSPTQKIKFKIKRGEKWSDFRISKELSIMIFFPLQSKQPTKQTSKFQNDYGSSVLDRHILYHGSAPSHTDLSVKHISVLKNIHYTHVICFWLFYVSKTKNLLRRSYSKDIHINIIKVMKGLSEQDLYHSLHSITPLARQVSVTRVSSECHFAIVTLRDINDIHACYPWFSWLTRSSLLTTHILYFPKDGKSHHLQIPSFWPVPRKE